MDNTPTKAGTKIKVEIVLNSLIKMQINFCKGQFKVLKI